MIQYKQLLQHETSIAVVGLGYVGLPLAVSLARHFKVIGFDIQQARINNLNKGIDQTREVDEETLSTASIEFTSDPEILKQASVYIVAVPTPINPHRHPNLTPIQKASETVAKALAPHNIVVYESTVYPGVTEEICVPILEEYSKLKFNSDFTVGYSPERINPGDKVHTIEKIVKVVSGSDQATKELLAELYGTIVKAGIHQASSIKVAEAAKVIENTQRDINIALINELAIIFDLMNIDTLEVLEAAGTKWNFLPFRPGLVGGHCIGVDPYYLTFRAQELGYDPNMILVGRGINNNMGKYIAEKCVKKMINQKLTIHGSRVGLLGLTFKENVPDLRNTRVIDIQKELSEYGVETLIHDPYADHHEAKEEYGISLVSFDELTQLDALVIAVPHDSYNTLDLKKMKSWFKLPDHAILIDIKGFFDPDTMDSLGYDSWRL